MNPFLSLSALPLVAPGYVCNCILCSTIRQQKVRCISQQKKAKNKKRKRKNKKSQKKHEGTRSTQVLQFLERAAALYYRSCRSSQGTRWPWCWPRVSCQQLPAGAGRDWSKANSLNSLMSWFPIPNDVDLWAVNITLTPGGLLTQESRFCGFSLLFAILCLNHTKAPFSTAFWIIRCVVSHVCWQSNWDLFSLS